MRVSPDQGGAGFRLHPSGYTLLEDDSPRVHALLRGLLRLPPSALHVQPWLDLVDKLPASRQKPSKHQASVSAYRHWLEEDGRRSIRAFEFSVLRRLRTPPAHLHPMGYGDYIVSLIVVGSVVRELFYRGSASKYPLPDLTAELRACGLLTPTGAFATSSFKTVLSETTKHILDWLSALGLSVDVRHRADTLFTHARENLVVDCPSLVDLPRTRRHVNGLGVVLKALRVIADQYYAFALFCLGSLLKANIVHSYLLYGPTAYREYVRATIRKRGASPCLYFRPRLFDVRPNTDAT